MNRVSWTTEEIKKNITEKLVNNGKITNLKEHYPFED